MSTLSRLSVFALSAVLGSALLFAGSADARKRGGGFGPTHEPTEAQKEVRSLKHEIAVTELFFALALDNDTQVWRIDTGMAKSFGGRKEALEITTTVSR